MNLKELRTNAKMTQQELADKIGVQRSTIAMIETDKNSITISMAKKLAKVFNIRWTNFFNE